MIPFRDVLDLLAVGVIVHDADTRIVYSNHVAERMLGIAGQELLQRDTFDARWALVHPDGRPFAAEEIPVAQVIRTGKALRGTVVGVLAARETRMWLLVNATPLCTDDGAVDRVVVSFSDITAETDSRLRLVASEESLGEEVRRTGAELTEARRALALSRAEFQAVLRAMAEGVAVHAADGSILFANPAAERILGLSLAQMQGQHPVDPAWRLTNEAEENLAPDEIPSEITRRTGVAQANVILGVHRDLGTPTWLSVSTDPVTVASGDEENRPAVVATFTDVTAERDALHAAQHARDHLEELASALPGVVIEYLVRDDGSDAFLYVSEPARDYFGAELGDLLASPSIAWARVHPEDAEAVRTVLRRAVADHTAIEGEFRVRHLDGEYRYVRARSGVPATVRDGTLFRMVFLDVTEQRLLEHHMRDYERRESVGTLAAGIAHNFNNLLATILPNIEMVRAAASPDLREPLTDALSAASAAAELVRQLMQLVRSDQSSAAEAVDVAALADNVARMCRGTFEPRIQIRVDAEPGCTVLARPSALEQVLLNLAINARDALEGRASPQFTIAVARQGAHTVTITVSDNGSGMTEVVRARLGQPFFTTKAPGKGTGLGIATAIGTIRDLGGEFHVASTGDEGSRFEIRLPYYAEFEPEPRSPVRPASADALGMRLLVIDDEPLVRKSLTRLLERLGCGVAFATNGPEALHLLTNDSDFDGLLVDLAMPGMGGAEVLTRVRDLGLTIPAFVVSGFVPDGVRLDDALGVLSKPFTMAQLRAACEQMRRHTLLPRARR